MVVAALVVVVVVLLLLLYLGTRKPRGFPPGPPRLPVLGFLPFLPSELRHKHVWRLSATYGPVVGVFLGNERAIFVNGWDAVKESLLNEDLNGRPEAVFNTILYKDQKGLVFTEGELWRQQRRFVLHHLRNLGFGKSSHEAIVLEEVGDLLQEMKETKGSLRLQDMLGVSNVNILWALMGGTRLGRQDPRLWELVDGLNKAFPSGRVTGTVESAFPILLRMRPQDSFINIIVNNFKPVQEFIKKSIEEHRAELDPGNPRDFMDIYITEVNKQKSNPDTTFTDAQMLAACTDLFTAGAETTSSTVSFGVLFLALHPEVMRKVQQELDAVVGRSRLPSVEDRKKLVNTDATLSEVFRIRGVAPLGAAHKALKDTTLQGHRIPAGTVVLNNHYSVLMDPDYWGDPENFRPERFINPDGSLRKDERLITFGKGRRVCLGESLARMSTFLLLASLVQHFTFTLDPAVPVPNTEGRAGITLGPPEFRVFASPRL